jgi:hypothetical protein
MPPEIVFSSGSGRGIPIHLDGPVRVTQLIDNTTEDAAMQITVYSEKDFRVLSPWKRRKAPFDAVMACGGVVNGKHNYNIIYDFRDPLCPRHILSDLVLAKR